MRNSEPMAVARANRQARRAHRKRLEILGAAKARFLDRAFGEVTMDEIAAAADVSRATLYSYFKNKSEVYGGVLYEDMNVFAGQIEAAFRPEASASDNLRAMTGAYMRYFKDHPEYFRKLSFFFFPGREEMLPPAIATGIERRLKQALATVEACIKAGIRNGEVRKQDARAAALALWGLWMGVAYAAITGHDRRFDRTLEQIYMAGVANYLDGLRQR